MNIYIDENLPQQLANGFDILQQPLNVKLKNPVSVKSIASVYGRGAKDEEWIPKLGAEEACVVTQDYNIKKTRMQYDLCKEHNLGLFFIKSSKNGLRYIEMIKFLARHWEQIINITQLENKPFAFKATPRSSKFEKI